MEDKLIELYESGNEGLCFQLMEGVDTRWVDLPLGNIMKSSKSFKCRMSFYVCVFANDIARNTYNSNVEIEEFEVSFYPDSDLRIELPIETYKCILADLHLQHLDKHIMLDHYDNFCLGNVPKEEIMKIIFAKGKDENIYKNKR